MVVRSVDAEEQHCGLLEASNIVGGRSSLAVIAGMRLPRLNHCIDRG